MAAHIRRCPSCGTTNHPNSTICRGCAANLPRDSASLSRQRSSGTVIWVVLVAVLLIAAALLYWPPLQSFLP
jgi:predicted nucleic acid-binding Zn ribbon protein